MNPVLDLDEDELRILLAESEEHLQTLDEGLVRLEQDGNDPQLLQAIFRAAHTLKGSAGMINHWRMADLTHALESLLDGLRKGSVQVAPDIVDACLEALDALKLLHAEIEDGQPAPIDIQPLVGHLLMLAQPASPHKPAGPEAARPNGGGGQPAQPAGGADAAGLSICVDISPESIAPAARAFQVMLGLQALGEVHDLEPPQAVIETGAPVRRVTARLVTARPLDQVRRSLALLPEAVRVMVGGEEVPLSQPAAAAAPQLEAAVDEATMRLGEFLVSGDLITQAQLDAAIQAQAVLPDGRKEMLGHTLVRLGILTQEALDRALAQQTQRLRSALLAAQPAARPALTEKTVRTSVERLDNLMNLVGELITDRNRLTQIRTYFENRVHGDEQVEHLVQTAIHLGRITDQLQEEVMRIRLVPIANVFNKFPRLVRDLARKADKQIELVVRGEDTELDRSVIEEIGDPLIHLLRNAVDHGVESPEERRARGKLERGTILLTARHEESRIIITVEDDGDGVDAERVKAIAAQKGLVSEAELAGLTREEALELIFIPGLSTAKVVSEVSGRGVGMDIVRTNIERLNGNIVVETWPGRGTRFQIMLPLTLAIIPVLLVEIPDGRPEAPPATFAIPLSAVMETLRLPRSAIHTVGGKPVTQVRGRLLPLVALSRALDLPAPASPREATHEYVVAVRWGRIEMGLIVDRLVGEQELVIKSLGALIGDTPGLSGAAILGDGRVSLIVDIPGLVKLAGVSGR